MGGKARSLIQTTLASLPIPEGLALTVAFFQPWTDAIKASEEIMSRADSLAADGDIQQIVNGTIAGAGAVMNDIGVVYPGAMTGRKFRKIFRDHDIEAEITRSYSA